MVNAGLIQEMGDNYDVTIRGEQFFSDFGLNLSELRKKRRSFSSICLDWSERQHHLAGALGNALTSYFFEMQWITHISSTRAVEITNKGRIGFKNYFNIHL